MAVGEYDHCHRSLCSLYLAWLIISSAHERGAKSFMVSRTKTIGEPHVLLCGDDGTPDADVSGPELVVVGLTCLLRLGAGASSKVQACLWNWHITHDGSSWLMTHLLFRRLQPSQGRLGRMLRELGLGEGIPFSLPEPATDRLGPATGGGLNWFGLAERIFHISCSRS
jgi:hypothetical protein